MITRRTAVFSVTTIAAGWSAALAGCGSKAPDTLKIGLLVSLSGPASTRGKDLLRGAEMAAEELNAAGYKIAGRVVRVEIVPFDDKSENDVAAQGAAQLIAGGAHAIVGPLGTPQGIKAIPVVAEAGLPHLFTMTAANLHTMGKGNTFRLVANDDLQGRAAASFVQGNLRAQRVAVVYEATDYGKGLHTVFTENLTKAGGKLGSIFAVEAKADVTAEMANKIKAEQAEVVMLFSRESHLKTLFKSLQDVGHTQVAVVASNVVRNAAVAAGQIPVAALYATATALDPQEFHNGRQFVEAFESRYKERPVWGAHYSYDAMYGIAGAANSVEAADAAKLLAWLKTKELRTKVNHQLRFDATGEQHYASIAVYKAERGSWQLQMRSSQW
jgi:branched-chain amino acid transport system substrate-binding protein